MKKNRKKVKKINKEIIGNIANWSINIIAIILAIFSLIIDIKVKEDTAELTKFSDKPIYYKIRLYPTSETKEYEETDKYIRLNLHLVVDDFEIENKNIKNVNYNDTFTHKKYFMVYDYDVEREENKYSYYRTRLDEKMEAQLRLSSEYYATITEANYSKTPNGKYIYMLVYTETASDKNLDLIFFKYITEDNILKLELKTNENGETEIASEVIDGDVNICKEYFITQWSEDDMKQKEDLDFMFDVYNDLLQKIDKI